MKFQWISGKRIDEELRKFCIELEYQLRPKITRFLISHPEFDGPDFSGFYFEIDMKLEQVNMSHSRPEILSPKLKRDFDRDINLGFARTLFTKKPLTPRIQD
ncbi:hypothetical protein PP178_12515 [Zeaxanthinibacter sp. PT1]|uniref:hypothetical protein n=1 Tax=Zeaxanthinibacter TaxID=561554 RepID=UPI002348F872|nr:hypothetical protein [Zeaxanthinibacter sp. PT1]MDC6352377.1 hypothetical protein [Zeaxanthinibacter sp. PT1]